MQALNEVAGDFKGWVQGRKVLTPVSSVPTIFPQFDVATRVRGYPIQRVVLVHGPSNHGKTTFMLGLGRSFLERGHFYFHVDAEMTTPEPWVQENLGQMADSPNFLAIRPESFEETAEAVRSAADKLRAMRDSKKIPLETVALFGIDSLQKLVPKDFLTKLLDPKQNKDQNIDPLKGRGGMFLAALNTAWMRELIPLLYHCNAGLVLLGRESQNTEKSGMFDRDYKVGGGNAVYYDSSLVCRITRAEWVKRGSGDNERIIGERHAVEITKTKVGHKDAKITRCYFHTSNGQHIPAGFDRARDVLELGLRAGVLKKDGNAIEDLETGERYGANINDAVLKLSDVENVMTLDDLQMRVLAVAQPEETDEVAS
jgi:RecA/RadA recombinase